MHSAMNVFSLQIGIVVCAVSRKLEDLASSKLIFQNVSIEYLPNEFEDIIIDSMQFVLGL